MFSLMKPKQQSILGIDISTSSVKIIQLSTHGDARLCIEGFGMLPLPDKAIEGAIVKDIDAVADLIKKMLSMARVTAKQAVVAVPDASTISKVFQITEGLSDDDIEELVLIEADKYIPYPIDEINIDFSVLGVSSKNAALQDVLIIASRAEIVNGRLEALRQAGLDVKVVDVESYAIERAAQLLKSTLPAHGENKVIAIIDVGAKYSHLYVLQNMKIIYTRDEEFGENQLIDAIAQHYSMTPAAAKDAFDQKTLPAEFNLTILQPFYDKFFLQVKRTLQFFYSTSHHSVIDHIVLIGGIAKEPDIAQLLQEHLKVPTSIGNPLADMDFAKTVDQEAIRLEASSLMVACGLALRQIE